MLPKLQRNRMCTPTTERRPLCSASVLVSVRPNGYKFSIANRDIRETMVRFYRHETSAKRFVRVMVQMLGICPTQGTYRLHIYQKFIVGPWTLQDAEIGQHACMWFGWISADVINGFITLTEAGYNEAVDTSFTIEFYPSDDSFFEEQLYNSSTTNILPPKEQERRRLTAAELGWLRFENIDSECPGLNKAVSLYLAGQIDQEDCDRYILAHHLLQWDFGTINDD